MTVPYRITEARTRLGLSQKEVARQVGVSRQKMSYWENGSRRPDADELRLVADALGVSVGYLFGESEA